MSYQVHFSPDDVTTQAEDGDNLIQTAMRAGVHVNASCGGAGVCGKCRVILEEGELESPRTDKLSEADYAKGYRLACQSLIRGDVKIRVPVESQMDGKALDRVRPGANAAREAKEVGVERLKEEGLFRPPFVKRLVKMNPPEPGDNVSDLTRLINALRKEYGLHNLSIDYKVVKELPHLLREEEFAATVTLAYRPSHETGDEGLRIRLTDIQPGDSTCRNYALAVDLGTTTVWPSFWTCAPVRWWPRRRISTARSATAKTC